MLWVAKSNFTGTLECYDQRKKKNPLKKRPLFIILHFTQYGCGVYTNMQIKQPQLSGPAQWMCTLQLVMYILALILVNSTACVKIIITHWLFLNIDNCSISYMNECSIEELHACFLVPAILIVSCFSVATNLLCKRCVCWIHIIICQKLLCFVMGIAWSYQTKRDSQRNMH